MNKKVFRACVCKKRFFLSFFTVRNGEKCLQLSSRSLQEIFFNIQKDSFFLCMKKHSAWKIDDCENWRIGGL